MPLGSTPKLLPITTLEEATAAIYALQRHIASLSNTFDNAVGNAISPVGSGNAASGGNAALLVTEPPGMVMYSASVATNSVNKTVEAAIDMSFTMPARAVGVEVFYREAGMRDFKQSYATASPYRLIILQPGITYELQLAGEAANGDLGPRSPLTSVTLESDQANIAPADGHYVVTQAEPELTTEQVLTGEDTVVTIAPEPGIVTVGIATGGIGTGKLADAAVTTPKVADAAITSAKRQDVVMSGVLPVSLTGTGASFEMLTQDVTVTHTRGKTMLVTPVVTGITGSESTNSFVGCYLIANGPNSFTCRVVGMFFNATATITAEVIAWYW